MLLLFSCVAHAGSAQVHCCLAKINVGCAAIFRKQQQGKHLVSCLECPSLITQMTAGATDARSGSIRLSHSY